MEVWKRYKRSIFRYLLNDEECSHKLNGMDREIVG